MARTAKRWPVGMYSRLLVLYPPRYRRRYEQPMRQTFDDMLQAETHPLGRLRIWLRTLADLPVSAAKEHVTEGKDIPMNRTTKFFIAGAALVLVLANGASFWFGNQHARQTAGIEKVTTAQLADAMQQDGFYSSYGDAALLFSGTITKVARKDNAVLATFSTGRPYAIVCQFAYGESLHAGMTVAVAAPGGSADRLPHGVLLHNCVRN